MEICRLDCPLKMPGILPPEGQALILSSCACLQKTKTSLAVGPIMVGFFLFVVVGSGERSSLAEHLPGAQGWVPQAYPAGVPPSVNASVLKPPVFRTCEFELIPITFQV